MRPRLKMSIMGAAVAVVASLAVIGCAREAATGTAYNPATGLPWGTNAAAVPANAATAAQPATQPTYDDRQMPPNSEVPAMSPGPQGVEYGYATPSYARRYSVRTVRPRVVQEQPPVYYEQRRVVRNGRSTRNPSRSWPAARASVRRLARWRVAARARRLARWRAGAADLPMTA